MVLPDIQNASFSDILGERYLAYALSTITSRSLPDVRDGLKPVQRRLLFAMQELKLDPESGYKKCARVVGDVIGKFHPHGDIAVYDAMVRLAQSFAVRWPLIEGHGNFGNIDGDNAAAMRYTEARLTKVATALLEGISEDAVDFRDTYDGEEVEPVVLPAGFPNLLANGASGIAVGLATSIPPHNVGELCDALQLLLKSSKCNISDLIKCVPGPDFPTGGLLVEDKTFIERAYSSGRGSFRVRARWNVENLPHKQYQIVVSEIPFQVQKSRLVERIALLLQEKKLALLNDVRDESSEIIRLVLEPRNRTVDPNMLMEIMFRHTELETRVSLNMNVIDDVGVPRLMNLKQALKAFIDHRYRVLLRRTAYRLKQISHRLEMLKGYLVAYINLDEVIEIIRNVDDPRKKLMKRFELNEVQANAILDMRLRTLRKLEELAIREEFSQLEKEQISLFKLTSSKARQRTIISKEILKVKMQFGQGTDLGRRRTEVCQPPVSVKISAAALVERENVTIVCSHKGWIRAIKGHLDRNTAVKYKDGDRERFRLYAVTTDKLILFATNGRFYSLACEKLPGGRGLGEPLRLMIDLANDQDLISIFIQQVDMKLLVAASDGRGFLVKGRDVFTDRRAGKQVLNLPNQVEATICTPAAGDQVAVVGTNRRLLIFPVQYIPVLSRGRGVILQRYKEGSLSDVQVYREEEGIFWRSGSGIRREKKLENWYGKRGQSGRLVPKGFPKRNTFN